MFMRLAGLALLATASCHAADTSAKLTLNYAKASDGTCRLLNVEGAKSTMYVSVPGKRFSTCGRCVQISCQDIACKTGSSVVAYVVDAKEGSQASDPLQLSPDAAKVLTPSPINSPIGISWKFTVCPDTFVVGNIKACMMDGASADYLPIQFFNSLQPIDTATYNAVPAKQSQNGFIFESGRISDDPSYYANIPVKLTSATGAVVQGSLSFKNPSVDKDANCADMGVQFEKPSASSGEVVDPLTPNGSKSGGGKSVLVPAILGSIGGLVLLAVIIFCLRRHRAAKDLRDDDDDMEHGHGSRSSTKDPRHIKPSGPHQVVSATSATTNNDSIPPVMGGNTPTLTANTPSTTYSRLDSDPPQRQPPHPAAYVEQQQQPHQPFAYVVPERQPAAQPKVVVKSLQHIQQNQSQGVSYSDMFNDANRGMYARNSLASARISNTRDDRKSFDIDEERDVDSPSRPTEHDVQLDLLLQSGALSLHEDPFATTQSSPAPNNTGHATSPESYVRATSMPRSNSQKAIVPTFAAPRTSLTVASRDSSSHNNLLAYPYKKKREISQHQF
ncbi:hypothetical protein DYB28_002784 [Aphanomyces astaci]|uniref:Expansin-like EG45 domain-containing protein n=1 Tax=Aphanomyces astaci TaxID=112090 RepID=A0A397DST7_APHAT|nr:hypothetical protein DYB36_003506 [Aphanomyces astaci]RHY13587.1 hypothetical protein DYB25_002801 [Aphanomyces astaci]RHY38551.1 hypothetical protein DYB34_002502 [Aphanomyces astaci]RHY69603.1 hypothetical protein DYB30_008022 [Aphanomyces astaci]RHY70688.1 hypothetical protein DYB38_009024 [Aphanomyces astaci]